jgi:hypothetical protein
MNFGKIFKNEDNYKNNNIFGTKLPLSSSKITICESNCIITKIAIMSENEDKNLNFEVK